MKPSITVQVLLSVSWLAPMSHGQVASNPPAGEHIVTLSFNSAVLETAEAQRELGALQAKLAPRQAQLQSLNNEVEALRKQLTDAGDKLSDAERATRERSLETKQKELQRQAEDLRNDSQNESQQVFQKVAQKVYPMQPRSSGTPQATSISPTRSSRPTTRSHLPARQHFRMLRAVGLRCVRERAYRKAHLPILSELCSVPDSKHQLRTRLAGFKRSAAAPIPPFDSPVFGNPNASQVVWEGDRRCK